MTMKDKPNDVLLLAGKVLTLIMQGALAIGVVALTLCIPLILFFQGDITAKLIAEHGEAITAFPALQICGILLLALGIAVLAFLFFGKLRQIINSVGEGDPFAPENADRLNMMGWMMLGIYALMGVMAAVAVTIASWIEQIEGSEFSVDIDFDLTSLLMVVILFILARVFKHGAAMREDLEGTV